MPPDLRDGLTVNDREKPFFTGINGTLMARGLGFPARIRRSCPATALQVQTPIDIAAMADDSDTDDPRLVVYRIDNAVVPHTDPEP